MGFCLLTVLPWTVGGRASTGPGSWLLGQCGLKENRSDPQLPREGLGFGQRFSWSPNHSIARQLLRNSLGPQPHLWRERPAACDLFSKRSRDLRPGESESCSAAQAWCWDGTGRTTSTGCTDRQRLWGKGPDPPNGNLHFARTAGSAGVVTSEEQPQSWATDAQGHPSPPPEKTCGRSWEHRPPFPFSSRETPK